MDKIKIRMKYYIITILLNVLKILWILPIDKNKILFFSYNGNQYSDSPKILSDYIRMNHLDKKVVWAFSNPEKHLEYIGDVKTVNIHSICFLIEFCTSGTIVTNNTLSSYLPVRNEQVLLQTWHGGGPGKKTELMDLNADSFTIMHAKFQSEKVTAFCSNSKFSSDIVCRKSLGYNNCEIIEYGSPRSDVFFDKEYKKAMRRKINKLFGIDQDSVIMMYAPTFRGEGNNIHFLKKEQYPDLKRCVDVISRKYQKRCVVFTRVHPAMTGMVFDDEFINVNSYPEMQDLLCAIDILITDYSSCMHDFALLRKPCFLYTPDYDEYLNERGLYWTFDELPYSYSITMDGLIENIKSYDEKKYLNSLDQYFKKLGSFETGNATEKIVKWLELKWAALK